MNKPKHLIIKISSVLRFLIPLVLLFGLILAFILVSDAHRQKVELVREKATATRVDIIPSEYSGVKIALALGGGGAKGFAHIGVIQVLQENHIPIQIVTGTSAGSVVGSLFAYGFDAESIRSILKDVGYALINFSLSTRGIIEGSKLKELINSNIDHLPIQSLPKKFGVVTTDFSSGEMVLFSSGDVGQAVQASSSIPAIFQPVEIGGRYYVDGGLTAPVPVLAARKLGADVVIAVDISERPEDATASLLRTSSWFSTLDRSVTIFINNQLRKELEDADVVIRPHVETIPFFNFFNMEPTIKAGEDAARAALPEIRAAIKAAKRNKAKSANRRR